MLPTVPFSLSRRAIFCQFEHEADTSHNFELCTFNTVMLLLRYSGSDILQMMQRSWVKKQTKWRCCFYTHHQLSSSLNWDLTLVTHLFQTIYWPCLWYYAQKSRHSKSKIPKHHHRAIDTMCNWEVENTANKNSKTLYSNKIKIMNYYHRVIDTMYHWEVAHPTTDTQKRQ